MNKFGRWCAERGLDAGELDEALGVGTNTSYHYIRPLDHPRFNVPPAAVMERIFALTEGAIEPNDFYDVETWRTLAGARKRKSPSAEGAAAAGRARASSMRGGPQREP